MHPSNIERKTDDMRSPKVDSLFDDLDREISRQIKIGRRIFIGVAFGGLAFLSVISWGIIKLIQHFTG